MEINKEILLRKIKRGDFRAAAKVYESIAGQSISPQYLEHFLHSRRDPTGLQGKHHPLRMYTAVQIAVNARLQKEATMASLISEYLEMVEQRLEHPAPANEPVQA